jgi:hypothetical protein
MLATVAMSLCLKSYSQSNPKIDIKIVDNDTVFVFNKAYAGYLVNKFDSLKHFKAAYFDCTATLDSAVGVMYDYKDMLSIKDDLIVNLNKQILYCDELAESYERSEQMNDVLQKDLKRQLRKTKLWNGIGWAAISTTILTSILFIIK